MSFYSIKNTGNQTLIYKDGKLIEINNNPNEPVVFEGLKLLEGVVTDVKLYRCKSKQNIADPCKYPECNCKQIIK